MYALKKDEDESIKARGIPGYILHNEERRLKEG